jgi:cbb3-type cytochrome oxidase subunit 3
MNMTCAEFQKVLPYIIESGGSVEEEQHLRECHVCSDLVQDLRYICEQAKLLVPMEDPSPAVWDGIRGSLEREGLVKKPARARGRLLGNSGVLPWIAGLAAVVLVVSGVILYRRGAQSQAASAAVQIIDNSDDPQDQQLLTRVAQVRPEMKDTYAQNLKQVNTSIKESKKALDSDPSDEDARTALLRAYEQKAMVYEMATRSLQ